MVGITSNRYYSLFLLFLGDTSRKIGNTSTVIKLTICARYVQSKHGSICCTAYHLVFLVLSELSNSEIFNIDISSMTVVCRSNAQISRRNA